MLYLEFAAPEILSSYAGAMKVQSNVLPCEHSHHTTQVILSQTVLPTVEGV